MKAATIITVPPITPITVNIRERAPVNPNAPKITYITSPIQIPKK